MLKTSSQISPHLPKFDFEFLGRVVSQSSKLVFFSYLGTVLIANLSEKVQKEIVVCNWAHLPSAVVCYFLDSVENMLRCRRLLWSGCWWSVKLFAEIVWVRLMFCTVCERRRHPWVSLVNPPHCCQVAAFDQSTIPNFDYQPFARPFCCLFRMFWNLK